MNKLVVNMIRDNILHREKLLMNNKCLILYIFNIIYIIFFDLM
jgi:hypothetical protein